MPTIKEKSKKLPVTKEGVAALTGIDVLPVNSVLDKTFREIYKFRYTTGPFLLPEKSGSLDWVVLNNDTTMQKVRVTIFKCPVGTVKVQVSPGPIIVTLKPKESSHNANTYVEGYPYEVVVECNSQMIFPYVSVWPGNYGVVIPGTGINSASFIRMLP
jgi:hypothetical protein